MRVAIDKNALGVPVFRANGVVNSKAPLNVLACVHMAAADDRLTFTATDYDITLVAEVRAEIGEPGEALVNGRDLWEVVRTLPDGVAVELSSDEHHRVCLRMLSGQGRFHLNGIAPEEFPDVEEEGSGAGLSIRKEHLIALLSQTLFSASNDESRPALNGVLLEIKRVADDRAELTMVSTDGHRLSKAVREVAAADYDGGDHRCIVHRRGAAELERILDGEDENVRIEFVGRNIVFTSDNARLQVRQIEETFPDYQRVLPDAGDHAVTISRAALTSAIRRVSALASGKGALLRLDLEPADDTGGSRMTLEMVHADRGDAHEQLPLADYTGQTVSVGFNPRYLLDVCNVLRTESINVEINDQFSPCLLYSDEEAGKGASFVVMPMRL